MQHTAHSTQHTVSGRFPLESLAAEAQAILAKYEQRRAATLPLLRLIQERFGSITIEAEQWVAQQVGVAPSHVHEVVTFYSLFHQQPVGKHHIQICNNIACALRGASNHIAAISERLGIKPGETTPDGKYTLSTVECLCACEAAPMMQVNDRYVGPITPSTIETLLRSPESLTELPLMYQGTVGGVEPVISTRFATADAEKIDTYLRDEGYQAARKAVTEMTSDQVIAEVTKSNLRGLGGAGFPTGKKWSFIPKQSAKLKYLVVNADEGEPGTIKDRYIITKDPHRLIEGIIIAAYATGCHKAYVYVRGEYAQSTRILQQAIDEARTYGFIGKRIFNIEYELEVVVHRGAGAYICGEETALLSSLEGGKGFPRLKPPFPAIEGLFGSPTVINNVETLACVPPILRKGGEWFSKLGFGKAGGTRLFSLSGHVKKPGLYEASQGVTLRQLIEAAGGVGDGRAIKAVIPGGISAKILRADEIDVRMDFDSLLAAGTMAGSAGIIVMDDTTCMLKALWYASKFFGHESCGQCSPCREGTGWIFKIVDRIMKGEGRPQDLDNLLGISQGMEGRTICVFADAAAWPVQSYIMKFRDEFEFHIREKRCNLSDHRPQTPDIRMAAIH
ncbi:MAG: NADH-quinone oxidoreductase subunit NuoF [Candidatus Omnitrophica bacterium]|nr:NADH-quinone oxidoreductase subunit NuoF [Candidatus Omnitrophota bacterium]